jgi:hypothetical protein
VDSFSSPLPKKSRAKRDLFSSPAKVKKEKRDYLKKYSAEPILLKSAA